MSSFFSICQVCQRKNNANLPLVWILIGFVPVYLAAFRVPDVGALIEPHWFIFSSIGFFILAAYCFLIILDRMKKTGLVLLFIVIFPGGLLPMPTIKYGRIKKHMPFFGPNRSLI